MKLDYRKLCLVAMGTFLLTSMTSCSKEDELRSPDFQRLVTVTDSQKTETDKWIEENLTKPFNIEIIWRWDTKEVKYDKSYIPPKEQNVLPYAKILKNTFIKSYQEVKGNAFIKPLVPKQFLFLGEWGYNTDGTITLGQAESGNKIVFYGVNHWDERDAEGGYPQIREAIHTLYHEFGHILHQNKVFSKDFENISKADYTSQWYNEANSTAIRKGFTSSYSMLSKEEDFVEIISFYCTMTPEEWTEHINSQVASTKEGSSAREQAEEGRKKILQKLTMIKDYMKSSWDIDLDEIRDVTLKNIEIAYKDPSIFPQSAPMISGYSAVLSPFDHNLRSCVIKGCVAAPAVSDDARRSLH